MGKIRILEKKKLSPTFYHFIERWISGLKKIKVIQKKKRSLQRILKPRYEEKIFNVGEFGRWKNFLMLSDTFEFRQYSQFRLFRLSRPPHDTKISSRKNELKSVKVETPCFKTRPSRRFYDLLLQSYISLNYQRFFIVTGPRSRCKFLFNFSLN